MVMLMAWPAAGLDVRALRNPTPEWLQSDEGRRITNNVVSWQTEAGGWWKGYDYDRPRTPADANAGKGVSGFDNNATYTEMRLLARAYTVVGDEAYKQSFLKGLKFILDAQYDNGGWPQQIPPGNDYHKHITYNDNAMSSVMLLLKDIADGKPDFEFVPAEMREAARKSFERGLECVLATQIVVDGQLTGWCAQHDKDTLAPTMARSYELPSISGGESADIVMMLMQIENPDERVKRAIHSAVAWFERSKIEGKRLEKRPLEDGKTDTFLVDDPNGETLWGRFYDIETNRPFFCDRDGVKKWSMAEIGIERRNGYAWLRPFGRKVMEAYPKWVEQHGPARPEDLRVAEGVQGWTYVRSSSDAGKAAEPGQPKVITVAADGSGDHASVQAAIDAVPSGNETPVVIQIQPGTYKELIVIPRDKRFITLRGTDPDASKTVLTYDNYASKKDADGKEYGTSGSASTVIDADDFVAENLTFENSAGQVGQAVAVRIMRDRVVFRNCRFLGWQDTLYPKGGRNYFVDCYIEGSVDFIFGSSTAVFENCTIHSKAKGYITAANTPQEKAFGYVFLNCKLTGEEPTYLGRPWRDFAHVAFIGCEMGSHIRPEGWHNWNKPEREKTARFEEYQNTGPGADRSQRVTWSRELTAEEAAKYTVANILAGEDSWQPNQLTTASAH